MYYQSGFEHFKLILILVFYAVIGPIPTADPIIGASLLERLGTHTHNILRVGTHTHTTYLSREARRETHAHTTYLSREARDTHTQHIYLGRLGGTHAHTTYLSRE